MQFVKGLRTLYDAGARVFVEVGPKKALQGFAEDVLGERGDVVSLFTNHPKVGDIAAFNQALCGLYAAGLGRGIATASADKLPISISATSSAATASQPTHVASAVSHHSSATCEWRSLRRTRPLVRRRSRTRLADAPLAGTKGPPIAPVVITGAALGLPGTEHIFDDANLAASCAAINSSIRSPRASARPCSTSTSRAW